MAGGGGGHHHVVKRTDAIWCKINSIFEEFKDWIFEFFHFSFWKNFASNTTNANMVTIMNNLKLIIITMYLKLQLQLAFFE